MVVRSLLRSIAGTPGERPGGPIPALL